MTQLESLVRFDGWPLPHGNWEIAAEFTEVESGRNANRAVLEQALAAARLHRAPLVVAKVDRLTRSVAFLSHLIEGATGASCCTY